MDTEEKKTTSNVKSESIRVSPRMKKILDRIVFEAKQGLNGPERSTTPGELVEEMWDRLNSGQNNPIDQADYPEIQSPVTGKGKLVNVVMECR